MIMGARAEILQTQSLAEYCLQAPCFIGENCTKYH